MINAINTVSQSVGRPIRLQKIFQKGFFYPQKAYDLMAQIGQDEFVGNLPSEIFSVLKSKKGNLPSAILKVKKGFQSAAQILAPITEIETQTIISRSKDSKFIKNFIEILKQHPDAKITIFDFGKEKEVLKLTKKAEKTIQKALKGILPPKSHVQMEYLDSGSFANAFKVSFLDKDGNKVFDDYVLKTYKDSAAKIKNDATNDFVVRHIIASMSDKDLKAIVTSMHKGEKCYNDNLKKTIEYEFLQMRKACEQIKKENPDDLLRDIAKFSAASNLHGNLPEANAITFIKKFAGHKIGQKDNLILPDLCGIGNNGFSLAKFTDKTAPKPTRKLDLVNLGIISSDTSEYSDNVIQGRIIDFGGMYHSFSGELKDKTTLKYFKKIMNRPENQRQAFINRYTQEAAQTRDLTLKEKIMAALDAASIYVRSAGH